MEKVHLMYLYFSLLTTLCTLTNVGSGFPTDGTTTPVSATVLETIAQTELLNMSTTAVVNETSDSDTGMSQTNISQSTTSQVTSVNTYTSGILNDSSTTIHLTTALGTGTKHITSSTTMEPTTHQPPLSLPASTQLTEAPTEPTFTLHPTTSPTTQSQATTRPAMETTTTTTPYPLTLAHTSTQAAARSSVQPTTQKVVTQNRPLTTTTQQPTTKPATSIPREGTSSPHGSTNVPESHTTDSGGDWNIIGISSNSFTGKILLPIAIGTALSVLIIAVAYYYCSRKRTSRVGKASSSRNGVHRMTSTDRVMLLADSSEDEF